MTEMNILLSHAKQDASNRRIDGKINVPLQE
jgi:hypothetical protein